MSHLLHKAILKLISGMVEFDEDKMVTMPDGNRYNWEDINRIARNRAWNELGNEGLDAIDSENLFD